MIRLSPPWFSDEYGRVVFLRGVNLGGSSKVPLRPDGATYRAEGFFDHRNVSFVGRPFPLEEADEHFRRLKTWGFNTLRFLVTWEAVEHAGPGLYDREYLNYLHAIVKKAGEYGFNIFIDPHEDVWSRFSGGDGAPGWTFELLGMDITKFRETGAAIVHQTAGDPFPRMIWPTNNNKFAAATLFTLFFAGNDMAPRTAIDGMPVQEYLQGHFIASMVKVAETLKDLPNVIGYETMNEPAKGYIGLSDLNAHFGELQLGVSPTPWKSMQLASGIPQKVDILDRTYFGVRKKGEQWVNKEGVSIWRPGFVDIWIENGVWDFDSGHFPVLKKSQAFYEVGGRVVDFMRDYYKPFLLAYEQAIRKAAPDSILFVGTVPNEAPPHLDNDEFPNIVYEDHWYDGVSLLFKRYSPFIGYDSLADRIVLGKNAIQRTFNRSLLHSKLVARDALNNAPVMLGEIGIPFDMSGKKAYTSGDFGEQIKTFDRSFKALEANLLSYTLWNYTSDNTNARGDLWNDEDLSIFSRDQQVDPGDINSGGRALEAVVRPFPIAIAGEPVEYHFDINNREFELVYMADTQITAPTLIYVPKNQYPVAPRITCDKGHAELDLEHQLLKHTPDHPGKCVVQIRKSL